MNVLLITHALLSKTKDYTPFFDALKNSSQYWWHYFAHTWIVATPSSASEYAQLLYPHMETTDRLLVVKLQKDYQGWLPTEAWDWLNQKEF